MGKKSTGKISAGIAEAKAAMVEMNKNEPPPKRKVGRPTEYRPEYCEMLKEYMRGGNSFESFGAEVHCGKSTLYLWAEQHPEFMEASKQGRQLCAKFYENLGKMMSSGQLRRVTKEEPVLDDNFKPVIDPRTGNVLKRYEYAPTQGSAAAWIFMTKNLLGWRDKRDVAFEGVPGGTPIQVQGVEGMSDAELDDHIKALARKALQDE